MVSLENLGIFGSLAPVAPYASATVGGLSNYKDEDHLTKDVPQLLTERCTANISGPAQFQV